MSGLLPSKPEVSGARDPEPRVIGLESDDADRMIAALSSETSRAVFSALHAEPGTASDVANRVETSLQNAQYHLDKLETAGLIAEVDTWYSEKGKEMSVFAPTNGPLVVLPGNEENAVDLERILKGALGGVAFLAVVSFLIEGLIRGLIPGIGPGEEVQDAPAVATEQPATEPSHWLIELLLGIPAGLMFFLGGLILSLIVLVLVYWQRRVD